MSMLAERRQKQKWTLNPRGKQWSEDQEKFGQKMLEKMGWTSGKGLGLNEQGITEHVHVSVKDDKSGIGFKRETLDEAWTEHQDSFNNFLQQLQKEQSDDIVQIEEVKADLSGKSLELKSKQSRARVHYQKFIRGKDINKYSSKDIANIFGQKEININTSEKVVQNDTEESSVAISTEDNRGGVVTIHGGSMTDYFMKKNKGYSLMSKHNQKQECNSESECEHVGFGFASSLNKMKLHNEEQKQIENACNYAFENPCVELNSPESISKPISEISSLKKRKSVDENDSNLNYNAKKFKEDNLSNNRYENGVVNAALNLDCQSDDVFNGKEFEVSRLQFGIRNSALDISDENTKKRVTFNDHIEYSTDSTKKKSSRATLDKFEVENKKAKKKKKQDDCNTSFLSGFVNEALDIDDKLEEINDNEINERKNRKSKKRKGSHQSNLETIVEIPEEEKESYEGRVQNKAISLNESISNNFVLEESVSLKKRKKKKHKEKSEIITNIEKVTEVTEMNSQFDYGLYKNQENVSKGKKIKKKKCIVPGIENKDISETDIKASNEVSNDKEETEEEVRVKRKKKKKKTVDRSDFSTEIKDTGSETNKETNDEVNNDKENTEEEVRVKKTKKKKTTTEVSNFSTELENTTFEINIQGSNETNNNKKEIEKIEEEMKVKKKKKKQKAIDISDFNTEIDNVKKGKENIDDVHDNTCIVTESQEEQKTSTNESTVDCENSVYNATFTEETHTNLTNTTVRNTNNKRFKNVSSPWKEKVRMSKKLLKSLFYRNSVAHFPGSNIFELPGYGIDTQ